MVEERGAGIFSCLWWSSSIWLFGSLTQDLMSWKNTWARLKNFSLLRGFYLFIFFFTNAWHNVFAYSQQLLFSSSARRCGVVCVGEEAWLHWTSATKKRSFVTPRRLSSLHMHVHNSQILFKTSMSLDTIVGRDSRLEPRKHQLKLRPSAAHARRQQLQMQSQKRRQLLSAAFVGWYCRDLSLSLLPRYCL